MSGTAERRAARQRSTTGTATGAGSARPAGGGGSRGPRPSDPERPADRRALDPDRLAELEEERDHLLSSLRDLEAEHDAGDLDDHDYAELREGYTSRAAAVLRAIEQREAGLAAARGSGRSSRGRTAGIVLGVIVFAVLAGVLMASAAGRRTGSDSVTGDIRQTCRQGLLEAQELLNAAPVEALKKYDEVLDACPGNAEALTYKGWLFHLTSKSAEDPAQAEQLTAFALQNLDDAVVADPDFADARIFRAVVLRDLGRIADARADFAQVDPDSVPPFMTPLLQSLETSLEGPATTGTTGTTS